jgi:4-amino-4-deoxy-L-arabinose transferase-like glycosyltransferase
VQATLSPLRILLALLARLWQILGHMGLYALSLAALLSMWLLPRRENERELQTNTANVNPALMSVMMVYWIAMAVVGGAVLARYMLPVVPLAIIICISALSRRIRRWHVVVCIVALVLVRALFVNPSYGFAVEDNLAYRDYIILHLKAEHFLEARYPEARVVTAWPASGELTQPHLGYVMRPIRVKPIEDFSYEQLLSAHAVRFQFDIAMVFSTKYEPPNSLFKRWPVWQEWRARFFGYHRDETPPIAAGILGGHLVYTDNRNGQWVGVIELDRRRENR